MPELKVDAGGVDNDLNPPSLRPTLFAGRTAKSLLTQTIETVDFVMPALDMTLDELLEEFDDLPDWGDRCDLLIDLGMELPKLDATEKVEANRVVGCQSSVWMVADVIEDGGEPRLNIRAESDSMFVSGLIAILLLLFDGKTPGEILEADPDALFERLDLQRHLSSQRRNGLNGMVQRIRSLAARAARQST